MAKESERDSDVPSWTFLTNHTHVLVCLGRDPDARVRDVAARVGITERAVQAILGDLERSGALVRMRDGRRNHYEVRGDVPLRHPIEATTDLGTLLDAVLGGKVRSGRTAPRAVEPRGRAESEKIEVAKRKGRTRARGRRP